MKKMLIMLMLAFTHVLMGYELPMDQLKCFADGLNIEGGTIPRQYLQEEQIWVNLCVVLDRPFEDGLEWQELTHLNPYPLKEASLLEYNEAQVNYSYAAIMHYYITHAHQIAHKSSDQTVKILIQVHRNTSGPAHVRLLESLLMECCPDLQLVKEQKVPMTKYELYSYAVSTAHVEIDFCYGTAPENLGEIGKYMDADVVISFSLIAGLNPNWKSGSLVISDHYVPFPLKESVYSWQKQYYIRNHLKEVISDIVKDQDQSIVDKINAYFRSPNPQKAHLKAQELARRDFKQATLLQVDDLFNPSQLPSHFKIDGF